MGMGCVGFEIEKFKASHGRASPYAAYSRIMRKGRTHRALPSHHGAIRHIPPHQKGTFKIQEDARILPSLCLCVVLSCVPVQPSTPAWSTG